MKLFLLSITLLASFGFLSAQAQPKNLRTDSITKVETRSVNTTEVNVRENPVLNPIPELALEILTSAGLSDLISPEDVRSPTLRLTSTEESYLRVFSEVEILNRSGKEVPAELEADLAFFEALVLIESGNGSLNRAVSSNKKDCGDKPRLVCEACCLGKYKKCIGGINLPTKIDERICGAVRAACIVAACWLPI
jgi:hypothetical protein